MKKPIATAFAAALSVMSLVFLIAAFYYTQSGDTPSARHAAVLGVLVGIWSELVYMRAGSKEDSK